MELKCWENNQIGEMIIMKTLNGDMLIKHMRAKQAEYHRRRELVKASESTQEATDYQIRLMVLDNLLIRVVRGDFDVKPNVETDEQPITVADVSEIS